MSVINSGKTFSNGEQLSADKLNLMLSGATFETSAVDNVSTQLSGGAIIVKDGGVSTAKIADNNVTTSKIADNNVTTAKIADSNVTFAKLANVIDDDTMATASNTTIATSESIKAYVAGFRPKFVSLTGGTTNLIKSNQGNNTTVTYNIADFTSIDSDFSTQKIIGIVVQGFVASTQNANRITVTLPGGSESEICRASAYGNGDHTEDMTTTTIPVNSDTTSMTLTYYVGDSSINPYNSTVIKGVIILPSL